MFSKFSLVFVAIFCITKICADVSHVVAAHGGAAVDPNTINILKRNISNYLVHLDSDGGPQQMQLKHIYGATKTTVQSTIYTVQALLETSSGEKKRCEIRVLEEPLFDFCQMRITCENGGTYEVSMNQHGTHSHPFGLPDYIAPQTPYQPQQHKPQQHKPQQQKQHGEIDKSFGLPFYSICFLPSQSNYDNVENLWAYLIDSMNFRVNSPKRNLSKTKANSLASFFKIHLKAFKIIV